jgi:DNA-binding PadR family transcriptional regulator
MTWTNTVLDKLCERFDKKVFKTRDVMKIDELSNKYSKGTIHRILHDLVKNGRVERLGRGTFRAKPYEPKSNGALVVDRILFSDRLAVKLVPGTPMEAKELLHSKGTEFMITGEAVFYRYIHNLPKRLIELVYVVKGSGEYAVSTLREAGLRALLNPTRNEISVALESFSERDLFVIREFSELPGNVDGFASLERALVDLYFETTRNRIAFSKEEVARILLNVLEKEPVSYSRMMMFAARRGIGNEIREILNFINPSISPAEKTRNRRALEFLDLLHKLEWR